MTRCFLCLTSCFSYPKIWINLALPLKEKNCWLEINCFLAPFAVSMRLSLEIFFIAKREHRDEKLQAIILKVSKIFRRQTFLIRNQSAEKNCAHTQFTWGDPTNINLDNNLLCSCFVSEVARRTRTTRKPKICLLHFCLFPSFASPVLIFVFLQETKSEFDWRVYHAVYTRIKSRRGFIKFAQGWRIFGFAFQDDGCES